MTFLARHTAFAIVFAALPALAAWQPAAVTPAQLRQIMLKDQAITIVDVRSPQAFAQSRLPGAINVPLAELRRGASPPAALRKDRAAYLYCT